MGALLAAGYVSQLYGHPNRSSEVCLRRVGSERQSEAIDRDTRGSIFRLTFISFGLVLRAGDLVRQYQTEDSEHRHTTHEVKESQAAASMTYRELFSIYVGGLYNRSMWVIQRSR